MRASRDKPALKRVGALPIVGSVRAELDRDLILISSDTLKLRLDEFVDQRTRRGDWRAAGGTVVTLGATLATARFQEFAGVPGESVATVFVIAFTVFLAWFVFSLWRSLTAHGPDDAAAFVDSLGSTLAAERPGLPIVARRPQKARSGAARRSALQERSAVAPESGANEINARE